MTLYTNNHGISLPMAVWLAADDYDLTPSSNVISTTGLLRSVRQTVLSRRIDPSDNPVDLTSRVASRLGQSIHTAIEDAWTFKHREAMLSMGIPKRTVNKIVINPDVVTEGSIPIYLEQRASRPMGNWEISGKFDMVFDGEVQDNKSTSVIAYMKNRNTEKFSWQGSIYRWLNPTRITKDTVTIHYIFKDWSAGKISMPGYPNMPLFSKQYPLKSLAQTEGFIRSKLFELDAYIDRPEEELPPCSNEDLWMDPPSYQYFSSPDGKKASKNFDNIHEANTHQIAKGKGVVRTKEGKAKACSWCAASKICSQFARLSAAGLAW